LIGALLIAPRELSELETRGDDTADENGFEAINEAGGISIRVRPRGPTAAQYRLDDVTRAIAWLAANFEASAIPHSKAS